MADIESAKETKRNRQRMEIFRFADGKPLNEDVMHMEPFPPEALAGFGRMREVMEEGGRFEETRMLYSQGDDGLSLAYAWFKSGVVLPKHSHNADCLYYVLGGELRMGTQVLRKGDGVFIPADAGYTYDVGPEGVEVLEFRNAGKFNFAMQQMAASDWDRMVENAKENAPKWADQKRPTEA